MQNYEERSKKKGFDFVANFSFLLWFRLQANYVKSEKIEIEIGRERDDEGGREK